MIFVSFFLLFVCCCFLKWKFPKLVVRWDNKCVIILWMFRLGYPFGVCFKSIRGDAHGIFRSFVRSISTYHLHSHIWIALSITNVHSQSMYFYILSIVWPKLTLSFFNHHLQHFYALFAIHSFVLVTWFILSSKILVFIFVCCYEIFFQVLFCPLFLWFLVWKVAFKVSWFCLYLLFIVVHYRDTPLIVTQSVGLVLCCSSPIHTHTHAQLLCMFSNAICIS